MTTFVLIHGAWRGSWLWKKVRPRLQAQGHQVFTPSLSGVGERSHLLAPEIDLETHINDVLNLIRWEELSDIVLCGHSYAGCVATGVADRVPERIRALVYLDAFVPGPGQSLHDLLPEEQRQMQINAAQNGGEGWKVSGIPAEHFNVNPADRAWVNQQDTPQSLATFQQALTLKHEHPLVKDISYIYATNFENSPFTQFYEKAQRLGWETHKVHCGHDVMLDEPEFVVNILQGK